VTGTISAVVGARPATGGPDEPSEPGQHRALVRRTLVTLVVVAVLALLGTVVVGLRPGAPVSAPQLRVTTAVSCPVAGSCVAMDDMGDVSVLRDGSWSAPRPVDDNSITALSCPDPRFCVAVDNVGAALVMRGDRWSAPQVIDGRSANFGDLLSIVGLTGVSCPSPRFCVAVDALGRAVRFDGRHWQRPTLIETPVERHYDRLAAFEGMEGVACPVPGTCTAISVVGRALPFGGRAWGPGPLVEPEKAQRLAHLERQPGLTSISCPTVDFCVATDAFGEAYVYDGTTWSDAEVVDPSIATELQANRVGPTPVSCPTTTFCMALDSVGAAVRFDGTSWSAPVPLEPAEGMRALSCASARFCVGVDDVGRVLRFDGTSWSAPARL